VSEEALAEYRARGAARRLTLAARERDDFRISQLRLVAFGFAVLAAVLAWRTIIAPVWLVLPIVGFAILVLRHERTIRARDAAARAVAFYDRGIARIEDRWIGTGETGDRFRDDEHLYANDLDLFGRGSLFELLSIARTPSGEETLAAWLKSPADPAEIPRRHDAVAELTSALDLREALSLAGNEVRTGVHTDQLIAWAEAPVTLGPPWRRHAAIVLTSVTVATVIVAAATGNYIPLLIALVAQSTFRWSDRHRIDAVLHGVQAPARDLAIVQHLLRRIERETFRSPRLVELRAQIDGVGTIPASTVIRRLERLVEAHDWEHNIVFAIVAAVTMWGTHIAWGIETWRRHHGLRVGAWLRAAGEIEALSSISAYRYEHPHDPFPVIVPAEASDGSRAPATYDGTALGHPLVPSAKMVPNDVRLVSPTRLLIVSGSNMSGKSTLLRTVGVNAVLALAGAPVRAGALRLSPLTVGATLRIQDSLQEGRSRFYAEITRVRNIAEVARGPRPLLFLLDEIFHGTNSHDRLVGASGVLRSLLDLGAIGLITTHDLALTAVGAELGARAANVHFEDHFEGGDIQFDYRMKPGPVTRSNALALMRAVGLEVSET
jgi:hypothetical protein